MPLRTHEALFFLKWETYCATDTVKYYHHPNDSRVVDSLHYYCNVGRALYHLASIRTDLFKGVTIRFSKMITKCNTISAHCYRYTILFVEAAR